jgi:very-short-patch-repair endonuclease
VETPDARLARHAATHFGVFTHEDARATGLTDGQIRVRLRTGRGIRLRPRVYRLAGVPADQRAALLAAAWAAGPAAVVSHRSAAWIWGLTERGALPAHVSVPRAAVRRPAGVVVHRTSIEPWERRRWSRIPVTSPERTLEDLVREPDAQLLLDEALRLERTRMPRLWRHVDSLEVVGRRSGVSFRRLLDSAAPRTRSQLERAFHDLILRSRLPMPLFNSSLRVGGVVWEVDAHWPDFLLAVELDSRFHERSTTLAKDIRKDEAFESAGWELLRLRWAHVVGAPDLTLSRIERRLHRRGFGRINAL